MKHIEDVVMQKFFRTQLLIVLCGTMAAVVGAIALSAFYQAVEPLLCLLPLLIVWLHLISLHTRIARSGVGDLWNFERSMLNSWLSENANKTYEAS